MPEGADEGPGVMSPPVESFESFIDLVELNELVRSKGDGALNDFCGITRREVDESSEICEEPVLGLGGPVARHDAHAWVPVATNFPSLVLNSESW